MRYFVAFVFVLALVALPLSASAHGGEVAAPAEEKMDLRVRRAGIGLGVSGAVLVSGGVMVGIGAADANALTGEGVGLLVGGAILTIGGLVATIITGRMLAERKRDRDRFREAHYECTTPSSVGPGTIATHVPSGRWSCGT